MSGEFGEQAWGPHFHSKIESCASDLENGRLESTKAWSEFFKEFQDIARAISWAEASDSSEARSITLMNEKLPGLIKILRGIDERLSVYREVALLAVEKSLRPNKIEPEA